MAKLQGPVKFLAAPEIEDEDEDENEDEEDGDGAHLKVEI
jgi:hypothetical protein